MLKWRKSYDGIADGNSKNQGGEITERAAVHKRTNSLFCAISDASTCVQQSILKKEIFETIGCP